MSSSIPCFNLFTIKLLEVYFYRDDKYIIDIADIKNLKLSNK